tara:strand:+ start:283 stop:519 length:237 start_codon:yes stop_codon:yes gene_type:complete
MAKQLDKDMMRMMSVTERFNYINDLKKMKFNVDKIKSNQEPIIENTDEWVDRDESDYDSSSDGGDKRGSDSYDDSNEY